MPTWNWTAAAAVQAVTLDPVVTASWKFYDSMSYAMNVYMRAATNLHTLENLIGKEAMLRVMRAFHTRFRFRHPTSRDFIATANEVSGRDLNWFFDELFFSTREWDYAVDSVRSREIKTRRGVFDAQGKEDRDHRPGGPRPGPQDQETQLTSPWSGSGAWARRGPAPASS